MVAERDIYRYYTKEEFEEEIDPAMTSACIKSVGVEAPLREHMK